MDGLHDDGAEAEDTDDAGSDFGSFFVGVDAVLEVVG